MTWGAISLTMGVTAIVMAVAWWAYKHGAEFVSMNYLEEEKKEIEVILIEESPPPSKSESSPRMSPSIPRLARRGGRRRFKAHARSCTMYYNPTLPHHCGFQAALKATGEPTNILAVLRLREKVAQRGSCMRA